MSASPSWVKPVSDYVPLAVFFAAYVGWDLYVATAALIVAAIGAVVLSVVMTRNIPVMPLVTAGVVAIFGGLTLVLQDETFIKMKPTIVQILMAGALFVGLLFDKPLLRYVMDKSWPMDHAGWRKLTRNFGLFFLVMAGVNEIVWRTQSTDFWVSFKVFGIIGLTLLFVMTQIPLFQRHRLVEDN